MNSDYTISDDKSKLNLEVIHRFLSQEAYWCKNIPVEIVQRSIENSLCFGVYQGDEQVGFARVITDSATFGYLADVFILPEHRGKGLSKQLMTHIMAYPPLQGLRRLMLVTFDAHGLYEQFGFKPIDTPENTMSIKAFTEY
ncbi:GNAT family N-acetyltransferase [Spirosoma pollinicola]|uniref:GNAT family N-acetyltransferase n=1 Tax=Spirosoma pollinicola TaxID=2057025 RepID=A0A2K8ZA32_9BACT|nr:GNAT family N-acetyltransferase [Spirosoma pollinicola]AUD06705.1 GNAT family N-acetyltransferase [Spirosoma pollinicola]